jgi:hypothetical protein
MSYIKNYCLFGVGIGHVVTNVGRRSRKSSKAQKGNVYEIVPKSQQQEAMQWLQEQCI